MQEKGLIIVGPSEQQSGAQELHVDWTSEQGRPKTRWRDPLKLDRSDPYGQD